MLLQRVVVALLLIPVGIAAIIYGGLPFLLLAWIVFAIAAVEYLRLFLKQESIVVASYTVLAIAAMFYLRWAYGFEWDWLLLPLVAFIAMLVHAVQYEAGREEAASGFAVSINAFYQVGYLGSFLVALRTLTDGAWWLILVMGLTWIGDMGAYFVGTRFGKHKLAPRLSPHKSWEGYLGGIALALLLAQPFLSILQHFGMSAYDFLSLGNLLLFTLTITVLSPVGDFAISMIKRQFQMKNTGTILPGHGGMLDRMDSILWAVPIAYAILKLIFKL